MRRCWRVWPSERGIAASSLFFSLRHTANGFDSEKATAKRLGRV